MAPPIPPATEPERFGRLETNVEHVMEMIRDLKSDLKDFRDDVDEKFDAHREILDDHAKQISEANGRRQTSMLIIGMSSGIVAALCGALFGVLSRKFLG